MRWSIFGPAAAAAVAISICFWAQAQASGSPAPETAGKRNAAPGAAGRDQAIRLYDDPRIVLWSRLYIEGRRDEVLQRVEADLRSASPHPFARHIWAVVQDGLGRLTPNWKTGIDGRLKSALGATPDIVLLHKAGKYKQLLATVPTANAHTITDPWALLYLTDAAKRERRNLDAFAYALACWRAYPSSYDVAWTVAASLLPDERIRTRVISLFRADPKLADTPVGRDLRGELQALTFAHPANAVTLSLVDTWLKAHPVDASALERRGYTFRAMGRYKEATTAFTESFPGYPFKVFDVPIWEVRAVTLLQQNQETAARAVVRQSADIDSPTAQMAGLLNEERWSHALESADRKVEAYSAFVDALKLRPDEPTLLAGAARTGLDAGFTGQTASETLLPLAQKAAMLAPDKLDNTILVIRAESAAGNLNAARTTFQDAEKRFTQRSPEFYSTGDDLYLAKEYVQDRIRLDDRALAEYPEAAELIVNSVAALAAANRHAEAWRRLKVSFVFGPPSNSSITSMRTLLAEKVVSPLQARAEVRNLVRRFPWNEEIGIGYLFPPARNGISVANAPVTLPPNSRPRLVIQSEFRFTVVCASPNGRYLATTNGQDLIVRIWSRETGAQLGTIDVYPYAEELQILSKPVVPAKGKPEEPPSITLKEVDSLAISDNGQVIAATAGYGSPLRDTGRMIRIWSAETGKLIRDISIPPVSGSKAGIALRSIAPDGKTVIVSNGVQDQAFDIATGLQGQPARIPGKLMTAGGSRFYSRDGADYVTAAEGRYVYRSTSDNTMWGDIKPEHPSAILLRPEVVRAAAANDKLLQPDGTVDADRIANPQGAASGIAAAVMSHDGRLLAYQDKGGDVILRNLAADIAYRIPNSDIGTTLTFSPDDRLLAVISGKSILLWNTFDGTISRTLPDASAPVTLLFQPDGRKLYVTINDTGLSTSVWDVQTGARIRTGTTLPLAKSVFNKDGTLLMAPQSDSIVLVDVNTGKIVKPGTAPSSTPDKNTEGGPKAAILEHGGTAIESHTILAAAHAVTAVRSTPTMIAGSPNRNLAAAVVGTSILIWDCTNQKRLKTLSGDTKGVHAIAISPDGKLVACSGTDFTITLWDWEAGARVTILSGHENIVDRLEFTTNGKYLVSRGADGTTRYWSVAGADSRLLATLIQRVSGDWVVFDTTGRYDSSDGGDVEGVHWVVADQVIGLGQLKSRYHDPGLLGKHLAYNVTESLRDVAAFDSVKLYPDVQLTRVAGNETKLAVTLTNQGGGIGAVEVRLNGRLLDAVSRGPQRDPNVRKVSLPIDISPFTNYLVPNVENTVEVVAYNAEGYLKSRGATCVIGAIKKRPIEPQLWALVVGVSRYRTGGDLRALNYPDKDAAAVFKTLGIAAGNAFPGKTHLRLLSTADERPELQPTKDNITRALSEFADRKTGAKPGDVLIIYLAGHGVSYGGQDGDFYFLTRDALTADLKDGQVRAHTTLSSDEIAKLVIAIPASRQVIVLDTCAAGRLVEKLTEKRDVEGSVIRSWERMKDRTGLWVLAGCAASASSYESSRYGQGVLTYSLLKGLKQDWERVLRKDPQSGVPEFVDVSSLFQYARDEVPRLAEGIGGIQQPVISKRGDASSFDVGRIRPIDRAAIPLASQKPVFLRSNIVLEGRASDPQQLTPVFDEQLQDASARGFDSPLMFWDVRMHPGAYRITGTYKVKGARIELTAYISALVADGEKTLEKDFGQPLTITGDATALDDLAARTIKEVEKRIATAAAASPETGHGKPARNRTPELSLPSSVVFLRNHAASLP